MNLKTFKKGKAKSKKKLIIKKLYDSYITADSKLSTVQKAIKNIPGPINPILVISLLTDKTGHLF